VSCSAPAPTTGITLAPELAQKIPATTRVLLGVDVARLRASPFYAQHQQLNALAEGIGLNFGRDASMVLAAWSSDRPVILFGKPGSSGNAELSQPLRRQLSELRKEDQIWVVSPNGLPLVEMPKRTDIASALSNITGYVTGTSAGLTLDTGLHLRADFTCISDAGAQRVRDAFRGGIAFVRLTTKDPDLQRVYQAMRVEQTRSEVILQADLSPELSGVLLRYLPSTASSSRLR
jgi:hypothetical protein